VEPHGLGGGDQRPVPELRLRRLAEGEVQQTAVGQEAGRVRHVLPAVFRGVRQVPATAPRLDHVSAVQGRARHDRTSETLVADLVRDIIRYIRYMRFIREPGRRPSAEKKF